MKLISENNSNQATPGIGSVTPEQHVGPGGKASSSSPILPNIFSKQNANTNAKHIK